MAEQLFETISFREQRRLWFCYLVVLMTDHLHILVHFPNSPKPLRAIVSEWKGWVAKQFGVTWQDDFFEHRLRSDESRQDKGRYILENPVRAGLVPRPEDWPYVRIQSL